MAKRLQQQGRRFVAYYRVSTAKQGREGLGIAAQREAVDRYLNGGLGGMVGFEEEEGEDEKKEA